MLLDLHVHSNHSDGDLSVTQLIKKAKRHGVRFLALADHDSLAGVNLFLKECQSAGITPIVATELSTNHLGEDFHLVLYRPRRNLNLLARLLDQQQRKRQTRAQLVLSRFEKIGFVFSEETKKMLTQQPNVGKPHLAQALLSTAANRRLLKNKFSVPLEIHPVISQLLDKPGQFGYVPKVKITTLAALRLAKKVDGLCSLAHPDLDLPQDQDARKTLTEMRAAGLWGLEQPHTRIKRKQFFRNLAKDLGLTITYGLDFHSSRRPGLNKIGIKVADEEGQKLISQLID